MQANPPQLYAAGETTEPLLQVLAGVYVPPLHFSEDTMAPVVAPFEEPETGTVDIAV